jgi:ABC-type glycerol-3-phosphate transport system substrate-binding protein
MKKKIMLAILVVLLAAAAVGYYVLNKKHFSVANTTAAAKITAVVLHQTFITDSSLAKNKFIGDETNQKVIQVEGEVSEIKKDQQDNTIILLKTATDGAFINSSMEGKTENIKVGSKIVIKGICTGYNFDAEMGIPGDVILTRCYLIK